MWKGEDDNEEDAKERSETTKIVTVDQREKKNKGVEKTTRALVNCRRRTAKIEESQQREEDVNGSGGPRAGKAAANRKTS